MSVLEKTITSSSSESDDSLDFPLVELTKLRDQVEYKRNASTSSSDGRFLADMTLVRENDFTKTSAVMEERGKRMSSLKATEVLKELFEGLTEEDLLDAFDDDVIDPDFSVSKEEETDINSVNHASHVGEDVRDRLERDTSIVDLDPSQTSFGDDGVPLQMEGQRRKRKSFQDKQEEKKKKEARRSEAHPVREACSEKCSKGCRQNFSEVVRAQINTNYWKLDWSGQRYFVQNTVSKAPAKRRVVLKHEGSFRKTSSYKYTLRKVEGETVTVCKHFYLTTLGYKHNNDTIITKTFTNAAAILDQSVPIQMFDRRGKFQKSHKFDHHDIKQHIEAHNPTVQHYRRAHAPNRRYLPSDITITDLWNTYNEKSDIKISYNSFYKIFKTMNISMAVLGNEECETCEKMAVHKDNCTCENLCIHFPHFIQHKRQFTRARKEYKADSALPKESGVIRAAADLQKVIMLPRIDQFKQAIFTKRLCVFNETFSELGKAGSNYAVVWHEAIAGRKDEDIASAFNKFLNVHRDVNDITVWADNCSGQNKNWTLFTMMTMLVNTNEFISAETIRIKFFEPGHTFMAADATHAHIEKNMKKMGKLYDYNDFIQCVKASNCVALEMCHLDFKDWQSGLSYHRIKQIEPRPCLSSMVYVEFRRGSTSLFYKETFDGDLKEVEFLKNNFNLIEAPSVKKPRCIEPAKKEEIIQKLLPLMPLNRRMFWENLPTNKKCRDLSTMLD